MKQALIFDIKRYAINDGPGIRITIFLKGCPLSCEWCHNPESQSESVQKMYHQAKCIGCSLCVEACDVEACILTSEGIVTDVEKCLLCGKCAEVCPTKATEMSGALYTEDQIMDIIRKEQLLMDKSEGGVTFSGGEPLQHPEFLIRLLDRCGQEGIHRCVDTCGFAKTDVLLEVAKRTDLFLYDLKMMDSKKHEKYTAVPNEIILENLRILAENNHKTAIRIPLIKGVNDDKENIVSTAEFISALHGKKPKVHILPFHNIAENKYKKLGQAYNRGSMDEPDAKRQEEILATFHRYGIDAAIGG